MKQILDLGCGTHKYHEDDARVIGIDRVPLSGVDIVCDFEKKLPFSDNSFDVVIARYIIEHIKDFWHIFGELYRILKPNGILKIWVPHFSSYTSYMNPEHTRHFSVYLFDYLYTDYGKYMAKYNFKVRKKRINYTPDKTKNPFIRILSAIITPFVNIYPKFYEKFLCGLIPCDEIYWELEKR